ncbi:MAG: pantoate--beta-alanine ligase, partial [Sphingobacteriia bacterium]
MKIARSRSALQSLVGAAQEAGQPIHFVPTMGALHPGHLALVAAAQAQGAQVVVSIFVNPTQFNQAEDLAKYPRQEAADLAALSVFDSLVVFLPDTATIYETGTTQLEHYDLGNLETIWEGAHRPGHFQGVCQVVSRLLKLVEPHVVFLGQKDFQQCLVLEKMM